MHSNLVEINNDRHFTVRPTCVSLHQSDWVENPHPGNSLTIQKGQILVNMPELLCCVYLSYFISGYFVMCFHQICQCLSLFFSDCAQSNFGPCSAYFPVGRSNWSMQIITYLCLVQSWEYTGLASHLLQVLMAWCFRELPCCHENLICCIILCIYCEVISQYSLVIEDSLYVINIFCTLCNHMLKMRICPCQDFSNLL